MKSQLSAVTVASLVLYMVALRESLRFSREVESIAWKFCLWFSRDSENNKVDK